jgi:phenylacetate-CoA ligase
MLLSAPFLQRRLEWIARMRCYAVFYKASKRCPAYSQFLDASGFDRTAKWKLEHLPVMTKENYVKTFSIEERCYEGRIPAPGTVIDESSGSSGVPNNWVRSRQERDDVKRILQLNYDIIYNDAQCVLLNCFALGPWATGMNVSMSLVDVGILKSIGPDAQKLENTLSVFGPKYRYLIFGYPPFIKSWLDNTTLDLTGFKMDAVVGGEGMSEALRTYLTGYFQTVVSSYGASDLEINIGVETELTIALRKLCLDNPELSQTLFGQANPPMLFQYNAADYVIESNAEGELLFSILRLDAAAPKLRYNLRDLGGAYTNSALTKKLADSGVEIARLAKRQSAFPILYVFGRGDLSVPFYGSKVFPTDLEQIINQEPELSGAINSFQIRSVENADLQKTLVIHLERMRNSKAALPPDERLTEIVFEGLRRVNQDFREVTRMFDTSCISVEVHDHETGVFAGRDIRIKNKYIA